MAATSFLQASAHDDMYGPDLDSFSEQWSSFNYAGTADANLRTPASNLGSPLMAQKPTAKNMRAFQGQGPTPPNTCRIFYTYDSQASSPMSLPVTDVVPNFDMGTPFVSPYTSRHGSPSGDCDIPGQFDAYLGSYGDLETVECPFPQMTQASIDPATGLVVGPGGAFKATSGQLLNQAFGPLVGSIEDLRDPNVILGHPINGFAPHMSPSRRPTHKRRVTSPRKLPRTPKTEHATVIQSIEDDCEKDELTLRDDAPEDDKFLFQLRKQFISEKGKGMWEEMKAKYTERNKGTWEKAALQMKVSRAVAKYGVWPKRELERLEESFRYVEERIYQMMLARMKELGGCKCWDWKPQHIEAQLVKMGLVEAAVDEKSGMRRRKQKMARRRALTTPSTHQAQMAAAAAAQQHHQQQQAAVMAHHHVMNDWAGGLGLHPGLAVPMSRHPSYEAHHMSGPMMAMASSSPDDDGQPPMPPPTFTSAEEDGILDQIFPPNKDLEDSMSPEAVGLVFDDANSSVNGVLDVEREVNGPGSQRVARQACEQMMQASMQGQQQFALVR